MKKNIHVKILGAGPSGSLLAIALASLKIKVSLIDILDINQILSRDRTYAITHSSRKLFEKLDIWQQIESIATPFQELSVYDEEIKRTLLLTTNDLSRSNLVNKAVGWTIDHYAFMNFLFKRINSSSYIDLTLNSFINKDITYYDYYFAADGILSSSRKKWNIGIFTKKYNQKCITFKAFLRAEIKNRAYEIFRKDGPMALLPMGSDLYQIIISSPSSNCEELLKLPKAIFLDKVSTFLPEGIEIDSLYNQPESFPLFLSISKKLSKGNNFLIGEAAHSIHPVGGQGLNLSFRDIESLLILFKENQHQTNNATLTKASRMNFTIYRYIDILGVSLITHSLVILFSNSSIILKPIRILGFIILTKLHLARKLLLSFMTEGFYFSTNK